MRRKSIVLSMVLCLLLGLASGCGNSEPTVESARKDAADSVKTDAQKDTPETELLDNEEEDVAEIVVVYPTTYATPDLKKVQDAVNEITVDKINVEVKLQTFELGSYNDQINLMISSGEKLDAMVTFFYGSTEFTSMAAQNQLTPLNELLDEYGQGIKGVMPEVYLTTTNINGNTLGVPVYKDNVNTAYYAMRTDILEKYGLTEQAQNIKSVDDMEKIMAVVKENEPTLVPIFTAKDLGILTQGFYLTDTIEDVWTYEPLYQEQIVAFTNDPYKAQSVFHSSCYEDAVTKVHDWYEKGYVYKDSSTTELNATDAISGDIAFSMVFTAENATMKSTIKDCKYDMTVIPLAQQVITSQKIRQLDWVIPVTSTEPEAAMKFMDLMYTDADIVNLLNYGIEGLHYEKNEDGTIRLPEGVEAAASGYYGNLSFLIGNQYLSYVWDDYDADTRAKSKEINDHAAMSPLLGFAFDSSDYANEISAITGVVAEYNNSLISGVADPKTTLEEFRTKLDAVGMPKLVDGIQTQLDEWLSGNK